MAELVDAQDLKSCRGNTPVPVRFRPRAQMKKNYFAYVLYSYSFKRLYIGHTDSLKSRVKRHNSGYVSSTKPYIPYELVYFEEFDSREKAIQREHELKSLEGRKFAKRFRPGARIQLTVKKRN